MTLNDKLGDELTLFCSFMALYDLYWYWRDEWASNKYNPLTAEWRVTSI